VENNSDASDMDFINNINNVERTTTANVGLNEMALKMLNQSGVHLLNFDVRRKRCASKPPLR
jgi:hypothetical protein